MAVDAAVGGAENEVAEQNVLSTRSKRKRAVDDSFVRRTSRRQAEQESLQQQRAEEEEEERRQLLLYAPPPTRRAAIKAERVTRQTLVPQRTKQQRAGRGESKSGKVRRNRHSAADGGGASDARRANTNSSSRPARSTVSQTAASSAPSPPTSSSPAKRSSKYVEFDPSPLLGVGLSGLGFGANLRSSLSLDWLRQHHSVRQLPVSRETKERLVNGSSEDDRVRDGISYTHFPWCSIGSGWYVGEWVKKCKLSTQQRRVAHMPHTQHTSHTGERDGVEESTQQSDDEAEENAVHDSSDRPDGEPTNGNESDMEETPADEVKNEQLEEGDEDEDESDGAAAVTMDVGVDGKEESHISPLKLTRKRGRNSDWQRHDCNNSCWEMRGYGYQVTHCGVQFVGQFAGGALNDQNGIIIDSSGVYCGGVVKGADEGCGSFYYRANNDVFTGMWRQGTMHYGSVLYGDHNVLYTGAFHHNKQDGLGVYDVFRPATDSSIVQHVGEWKAGTWNGAGKAVYANRTVEGQWLQEGTVEGSLGRVDWVVEEGMKMTYVGEMSKESEGCGQGRLRWEERSAGEKRQQEYDDKQRTEAAAKRKNQHVDRQTGVWSSLTDIENQQSILAEQIAALSATISSLPGFELPFTSPSSSLYTGSVQHSRAHGHGYRQWANGDTFSGHWLDGVCNGFGSWLSQDRNDSLGSILYSGHWKNDKEHGRGTLLSSMPSLGRMLFHGRFADGWLTGMGSVYFADSGQLYYVGRMAGGAFDGEGVMRLEDGSLFVGGFVDGTFRGKGRWVDTRECSVYSGRFKHDYKHGCGRLTIHQRQEEKSKVVKGAVEKLAVAADATEIVDMDETHQTAAHGAQQMDESAVVEAPEAAVAPSSAPAVFSERSDSDVVRDLSATKSATPEEALAGCHHVITLPQSFGPAIHSYLAIYNRDKPVVRIVADDLSELLEEIEYNVDEADVDEDGLWKEEQVDTTKEEKRKQRLRKAGKSKVAAVEQSVAAATEKEGAKESEAEREKDKDKEQDIDEAASEIEGNGMLILRHYQDELDRIHKQKAGKRRSRKDKLSATAASSSLAVTESAISTTGTSFLRQSLSQPPPPLASFAPPATSSHTRRIHLERAIAACNTHNVCSAAVTGQLPADYTVQYCVTCSRGGPGDDEEDEKRVEVCSACKTAGCHRSHQLRSVRVVVKGMEGDPTNGEAALFYCHCSHQADKCKTKMRDFSAAIDRASTWTQLEQQQLIEVDSNASPLPPVIESTVAGRQPQLSSTEGTSELPVVVAAGDKSVEPSDHSASPAPLKPSELRARSAHFVQRAAPADSEPPSSLPSASASTALPPPASFRSLLSVLSSSSLPSSVSCSVLPLSLSAPVRKAGPRWVKIDGKWVEESSN